MPDSRRVGKEKAEGLDMMMEDGEKGRESSLKGAREFARFRALRNIKPEFKFGRRV